MKLEKQVPIRELSEELKEQGYPQEGLFWWVPAMTPRVEYKHNSAGGAWERTGFIVAPTVAEMGEYIVRAGTCAIEDAFKAGKGASYWTIFLSRPNLCAKMLIWLRENGHLDFKNES